MVIPQRKNRVILALLTLFASAAVALSACSATAPGASSTGGAGGSAGKPKIFLNLSYSGNNWQTEGANLAMATLKSPEVLKKYSVKEIISGTDVQKQISDIQSMISAGAKLIVFYPISPTALNPVIQQGCSAGVSFVAYDGTVTAPCAWNVSYITGARANLPQDALFGAQTAQALVDLLHGKGNVMLNRGVSGTSTDTVHYESAMAIFKKHPGIKIVDQYFGQWDSSLSQQLTAKALASHPDVNAIWSEAGEDGVIKALQAKGMEIPVTGENSNYFREQLAKGWPGVSSGSAPAVSGVAVKLGLKILQDGASSVPKNIEMPLPWVTTQTAKVCSGTRFVNGCNFFPTSAVSGSFVTEIVEPSLFPEGNLEAAQNATPIKALTPLPALAPYTQPEWRRLFTRGVCDSGWQKGVVPASDSPLGLVGCVKK